MGHRTPFLSDLLHGSECRSAGRAAHRPAGSCLIAREVSGNRCRGAQVLAQPLLQLYVSATLRAAQTSSGGGSGSSASARRASSRASAARLYRAAIGPTSPADRPVGPPPSPPRTAQPLGTTYRARCGARGRHSDPADRGLGRQRQPGVRVAVRGQLGKARGSSSARRAPSTTSAPALSTADRARPRPRRRPSARAARAPTSRPPPAQSSAMLTRAQREQEPPSRVAACLFAGPDREQPARTRRRVHPGLHRPPDDLRPARTAAPQLTPEKMTQP
jgi:hypothetical protein